MATVQFIQSNVSIRPDQRETLNRVEENTGKSMSKVIRELIDEAYPLPKQESLPVVVKDDTVKNDRVEDINKLFQSNETGSFNRIFGKNDK
jgi:hypothetical protein